MKTTKHILYVHASNELYGSDVILLQLISNLDRSRFTPFVVLPSDVPYEGRLSDALTELGVTVYCFKYGVIRRRYFNPIGLIVYFAYLVYGVIRIAALVRQHNIDLIQSSTSAVVEGLIVAQILRRPHVWHIHEILVKPTALSHSLYTYVNSNTRVIAVSQQVADHVRQYNQRIYIQIIRNGIDCSRFGPQNNGLSLRTQWNVAEEDVLVGMVGRISHLKGQEVFVRAAAQACLTYPHLRFLIVGDPVPGDESRLNALKSQVDSLGIHDRVVWMSYTTDIPSIMRALDLLVVPSILPESSGLVALEAMASERPVIAAAHGGVLEIVKSDETGLLSAPGDADDLAQAILFLAHHPELRKTMGQNGRASVVEHFSVERFYRDFQALYETIFG